MLLSPDKDFHTVLPHSQYQNKPPPFLWPLNTALYGGFRQTMPSQSLQDTRLFAFAGIPCSLLQG